jgi:hypothetical protein
MFCISFGQSCVCVCFFVVRTLAFYAFMDTCFYEYKCLLSSMHVLLIYILFDCLPFWYTCHIYIVYTSAFGAPGRGHHTYFWGKCLGLSIQVLFGHLLVDVTLAFGASA